jgi:hypothetical protein
MNLVILAPFQAVSTAREIESEWNSTVLNTSTAVNVQAHTLNSASASGDNGTQTLFNLPAVA